MVDPQTLQLAENLRPLLLRLNRKIRAETGNSGLSTIQVSILMGIHLNPEIRPGDLALREGIRGPTLIEHLNNLQAAGHLIRHKPQQGDRRRTFLQLTPSGEALLQDVKSSRSQWLARRLEQLHPEQREKLAAAVDALQLLLEQP